MSEPINVLSGEFSGSFFFLKNALGLCGSLALVLLFFAPALFLVFSTLSVLEFGTNSRLFCPALRFCDFERKSMRFLLGTFTSSCFLGTFASFIFSACSCFLCALLCFINLSCQARSFLGYSLSGRLFLCSFAFSFFSDLTRSFLLSPLSCRLFLCILSCDLLC